MKAKKTEKRTIRLVIGVSSLLLIIFMFAAYLYQSFQIEFMMADLHQLHQEKKMLINQTELLQAEVSRLSNVDRIGRIAREKFKLVFSSPQPYVIRIEDGASLNDIKSRLAEREAVRPKLKTASMP